MTIHAIIKLSIIY